MIRVIAFLLAAFALSSFVAADEKKKDDKKDDKSAFSGAWTRESGGLDLKFEFTGKDVLKMHAFSDGGDNGVIVTTKYSVKDGLVKAKVTDVEVKGEFKAKPPKGLEFTFKWKVKGDTATLDDFEAEGLEQAKAVLEGDYARKKAKN